MPEKAQEKLTSNQLTNIEDRLDILLSQVKERFDHIEKKFEKLTELITGNGDPSKGLLIRVDRLEQKQDDADHIASRVSSLEANGLRLDRLEQNEVRRDWYVKAIMGTLIALVVAAVYTAFVRGHF